MFHKVKCVNALPEYKLSVQFAEGVTKIYDVGNLFGKQWIVSMDAMRREYGEPVKMYKNSFG